MWLCNVWKMRVCSMFLEFLVRRILICWSFCVSCRFGWCLFVMNNWLVLWLLFMGVLLVRLGLVC